MDHGRIEQVRTYFHVVSTELIANKSLPLKLLFLHRHHSLLQLDFDKFPTIPSSS